MKKDINIKSFEYDVSMGELKKQHDLELIIDFCENGRHRNLCIEYKTKEDCRLRRMTLRKWLKESEYNNDYYMRVVGNRLYVIKEREEK